MTPEMNSSHQNYMKKKMYHLIFYDHYRYEALFHPGRQPSWNFENAQACTQFTRRIMYMGHLGHPNSREKNYINQVRVQPKNQSWLPDYICVSTVIIVYINISPLNSYLYIHWILDLNIIIISSRSVSPINTIMHRTPPQHLRQFKYIEF